MCAVCVPTATTIVPVARLSSRKYPRVRKLAGWRKLRPCHLCTSYDSQGSEGKKREICWHTRHYIFQCFDDQRSSSSRTRYPSWKDTSNICHLISLNGKFVASCCGKIWSIFRGNFNRALIVFMENYSVLRGRGRNMTRVK